jgi:hypothetical protein
VGPTTSAPNRSTPVCSRSSFPVPPPLTFFHPSLSPSSAHLPPTSAHLPPIFRRFAANHGIQRQVGGGTPTASANPLHPTHHTAVSTATDTAACCAASGVPDEPRNVTVAGPGASIQSLQILQNVLSPGGLQQGGQGGIPGMDLVIQQAGQLRETLLQVRERARVLAISQTHHMQWTSSDIRVHCEMKFFTLYVAWPETHSSNSHCGYFTLSPPPLISLIFPPLFPPSSPPGVLEPGRVVQRGNLRRGQPHRRLFRLSPHQAHHAARCALRCGGCGGRGGYGVGRGAGCVAGNVDDVGVFGCSVRYVSRVVSCVCVCVGCVCGCWVDYSSTEPVLRVCFIVCVQNAVIPELYT